MTPRSRLSTKPGQVHVPIVHPGSLAKQKVKSRQRVSHVEIDGAYVTHFTAHGGSRGLLE